MRCRADIRTYHLSDDEWMRYVLSFGRGFYLLSDKFWVIFSRNIKIVRGMENNLKKVPV